METTYQPEDFIKIDEVRRLCHFSNPSIYRAIAAGTFPAPVKFGPQKSLWIRSEIAAWIADRISERSAR